MKVTSVENFILSVPTPRPMALQYPLQKLVCAEIATDEGLKGLGYSETMRIGRLAAAHSVYLSPHVVHELPLHVAGALPNAFLVEFIDWTPPGLFEEMPQCKDGHFLIPGRPGHGVALARGALEKYRSA